MPLKIEAILSNTEDRLDSTYNTYTVSPTDFWVLVSGVTPGSRLSGAIRNLSALGYNISSVTAPQGYSIGSVASRALVPIVFKDPTNTPYWYITAVSNITTAGIIITDTNTSETTVVSGPLFATTVPSYWTVTQDSSKNCNITCTSIGSGGQTPFLISLDRLNAQDKTVNQGIPGVFEVEVYSPTGASIFSSPVSFSGDGSLPYVQIPSASITTTGKYAVQIKTRFAEAAGYDGNYINGLQTLYKYQNFQTTLTAPFTANNDPSTMFSWLNSDYWYLTDLQLNIATRSVASRRNTISVRPNDTVQFAVLFNNGTAGVDPIATEVKIAVRQSTNNGPYVLWSAATVTTVAVGSDTYYAITVTASNEDLLSGQATQLLAGSNLNQTLVGQIQWTTTRGTFSSNSFTITAKNEVARESDI
jgi:hypothetical protein